jgi:hypothetical protein
MTKDSISLINALVIWRTSRNPIQDHLDFSVW